MMGSDPFARLQWFLIMQNSRSANRGISSTHSRFPVFCGYVTYMMAKLHSERFYYIKTMSELNHIVTI